MPRSELRRASVRTHLRVRTAYIKTPNGRVSLFCLMPVNASTLAAAPFKPPATCRTPVKDADLERILERLDRIIRDVGPVIDHIAEKLGLDLEGESVGNRIGSFPIDSQYI